MKKASKNLVLVMALLAVTIASIYIVSCSNQQTSNPVTSTVNPADSEILILSNPVDTIVSEQPTASTYVAGRLASDPRQAVILETYYALWTAINGTSPKSIGPWAAGGWNYLVNDMNAYNVLKGWYGSYSSGWSLFYSNPGSYGFYGGYGRGGQCVFFANLITYRSGVYQKVFPSYATCLADYNSASRRYTKHYRNIQPGDIIRSFATNGHTAIVVKVLAGTPGSSVTSVDVIDCNFIGNEIIGRHIISTTGSGMGDLDNYYAVDLIALGGR